MNKRILGFIYILALAVTTIISFFPIPGNLAWILRISVAVAALVGIYLFYRNKDEYRYNTASEREKKAKKK